MINNDVLFFSATNKETPYAELPHYWLKLSNCHNKTKETRSMFRQALLKIQCFGLVIAY